MADEKCDGFKMSGIKTAEKIRVTIDDEQVFNAWSFGEEWNNWAVPYFEKEEADKVVAVHNCLYNQAIDSYEYEQDGQVDTFESLTIKTEEGDKKVYAIGSGEWIWDLVND